MFSHWSSLLIILLIVLLLFGGRGKIPAILKDLGTGISAFRKGLKEEETPENIAQKDENSQIIIEPDQSTSAQNQEADAQHRDKR